VTVETKTISAAMRELAQTIQCGDGVANAACAQAAERLDAQDAEITQLQKQLTDLEKTIEFKRAISGL
jgi:2-hydroxy-3-keto-5-methylthiopentenyl-1-phosphate phosphatase